MCKATVQSHQFWRHSSELDDFFLLLLIFFLFYFIKILFIYLCIYLFFTFSPLLVCFCFVAIDFVFNGLLFVCACALLSWSLFFPSLFILWAVFISLRVGLGLTFCWLKIKIFYIGVVYKFLSVGMELAVIKDLFNILYTYIYFLTNLL